MSVETFDLEGYLTHGVETLVKSILKASLTDPRESLFMTKFVRATRKASKKRDASEKKGEHIPPFLIASITSSCNLHCAGCYSRANDACTDSSPVKQLTGDDWGKIFAEADDLGISFILLAGGEPLIRRDVVETAAKFRHILFPVFTNGTMITDRYLELFDKNRNIFPVLSIEGDKEKTDARRGPGIYDLLEKTMERIKKSGLLFGASITVTTENLKDVMSGAYVDEMSKKGCKLMFYIEYVPAEEGTEGLALSGDERAYMDSRLREMRKKTDEVIFLSFPGDEKSAGGCLATGRGFFHINSHGGAEPCPFSPFSDTNVRDVGVAGALKSKLFQNLRESGFQSEEHHGGCALFDKADKIEKMLGGGD